MPNLFPDQPPHHPSERRLGRLIDQYLPDAVWVANVLLSQKRRRVKEVEIDFLLACPQEEKLFLIEAKTWEGLTRVNGTVVERDQDHFDNRIFEKPLERAKALASEIREQHGFDLFVEALLLVTSPDARMEFLGPKDDRIDRAVSWLERVSKKQRLRDWNQRRDKIRQLLLQFTRRIQRSPLQVLGKWSSSRDTSWEALGDSVHWIVVDDIVFTQNKGRRGIAYLRQEEPRLKNLAGTAPWSVYHAERLDQLRTFAPLDVLIFPDADLYGIVEECEGVAGDPTPLRQWLARSSFDERKTLARIAAARLSILLENGFLLSPTALVGASVSSEPRTLFRDLTQVFVLDGDQAFPLVSIEGAAVTSSRRSLMTKSEFTASAHMLYAGFVLGLLELEDELVMTEDSAAWFDRMTMVLARGGKDLTEGRMCLHRLLHRSSDEFQRNLREIIEHYCLSHPKSAVSVPEVTFSTSPDALDWEPILKRLQLAAGDEISVGLAIEEVIRTRRDLEASAPLLNEYARFLSIDTKQQRGAHLTSALWDFLDPLPFRHPVGGRWKDDTVESLAMESCREAGTQVRSWALWTDPVLLVPDGDKTSNKILRTKGAQRILVRTGAIESRLVLVDENQDALEMRIPPPLADLSESPSFCFPSVFDPHEPIVELLGDGTLLSNRDDGKFVARLTSGEIVTLSASPARFVVAILGGGFAYCRQGTVRVGRSDALSRTVWSRTLDQEIRLMRASPCRELLLALTRDHINLLCPWSGARLKQMPVGISDAAEVALSLDCAWIGMASAGRVAIRETLKGAWLTLSGAWDTPRALQVTTAGHLTWLDSAGLLHIWDRNRSSLLTGPSARPAECVAMDGGFWCAHDSKIARWSYAGLKENEIPLSFRRCSFLSVDKLGRRLVTGGNGSVVLVSEGAENRTWTSARRGIISSCGNAVEIMRDDRTELYLGRVQYPWRKVLPVLCVAIDCSSAMKEEWIAKLQLWCRESLPDRLSSSEIFIMVYSNTASVIPYSHDNRVHLQLKRSAAPPKHAVAMARLTEMLVEKTGGGPNSSRVIWFTSEWSAELETTWRQQESRRDLMPLLRSQMLVVSFTNPPTTTEFDVCPFPPSAGLF